MSKSQRLQNTNLAGKSYIDTVPRKDSASAKVTNAVNSAPKEYQKILEKILAISGQQVIDSDAYIKAVSLRNNDVVLMRMASLLDELRTEFSKDEIVKIQNAIEGAASQVDAQNLENSLDQVNEAIIDALVQIGNDRKQDVIEIKNVLAQLLNVKTQNTNIEEKPEAADEEHSESQPSAENESSQSEKDSTFKNKVVDSLKDETEGDYQDSTIAKNFQNLQNNVSKQLNSINKNISTLTGFTILGGFIGFAMKGIGLLLSSAKSITSKIGSLTKNVVSKVFNISKVLAGGAIGFLVKSVKGVFGAIGKLGKGIFSGIGKLGKGISSGFSKIGNGIKGIGSRVGGAILHPFKAIGGFFSKKKKDKAAEKKERMREKFQEFMMNIMEKLWNFVEPILSKLKIFMLIALVPILTTALTVLAIIAAITLIVIGLVMVYLWVKNKLIPKIKAIFKKIGAKLKSLWTKTKAFFTKMWNGLKASIKAIWDGIVYFVSLKWLVDLGIWLWKKLCEFGNWLYNEFIYPWLVAPIEMLRNKLTSWLTPIMNKLQPFIESVQNLVARIKSIWQNFHWDENKSFFENLKCLASIVKDAVLDWWNTSPFKTFYETYLDPIIKSVQDLIGRIKNIWANFKYDENKSFLENLADFWDQCWSAIGEWWEGSIIKKYWDMLVDYVSDLLKPLREWYEGSQLKVWIDKIGNWIHDVVDLISDIGSKVINWIREKLGNFTIPIPNGVKIGWKEIDVALLPKFSIPIPEFEWKDWKPFGGIAPQPEVVSTEAPVTSGNQESLAQQQVANAMQPVNNINNMNSETNIELQKTGEEMSNKAAAAEQATQDYRQQQAMIGSQSLSELHDMREEMRNGFKDPNVVPLPMPYGPQRNTAMMYNEENY